MYILYNPCLIEYTFFCKESVSFISVWKLDNYRVDVFFSSDSSGELYKKNRCV